MLILASAVAVMQLAIDAAVLAPDLSLSIITREVHTIWAPYMEVVPTVPGQACATCDASVQVQFTDAVPIAGPDADGALGWIRFVNGQPEPIVSVSVARVRRVLADAVWMGRSVRTLPPAVKRRVLSQAVGRAIAHEIGHYVLHSARHETAGLMKARFSLKDLLETNSSRLRLSPPAEARLEAPPFDPAAAAVTAIAPVRVERW